VVTGHVSRRDRQDNHRFIEVKLPGDRVHAHQLKGMALIATCLRAKGRVSVKIAELRPEESPQSFRSIEVLRRESDGAGPTTD
jgi:hypothetical protein